MFQAIIGIVALLVLGYLGKDHYDSRELRKKQEKLDELDEKESLLDIGEEIVSKEILLKKREVKLNKEKEKL